MSALQIQIKDEPLDYIEYDEEPLEATSASAPCIQNNSMFLQNEEIKAESFDDTSVCQMVKTELIENDDDAAITIKNEPTNNDDETTDNCDAFIKENNDLDIIDESNSVVTVNAYDEQRNPEELQFLQQETKENTNDVDAEMPFLTVTFVSAAQQQTNIYKCDKCHDSFVTAQLLHTHINMHKLNMFLCKTCGATFSDVVDLEIHRLAIHKISSEVCTFCQKHAQNLLEHVVEHADACKFTCSTCLSNLNSQELLFAHWRTYKKACGLWMESYIKEHSEENVVNYGHLQMLQKRKPEQKLWTAVPIKRIKLASATNTATLNNLLSVQIKHEPKDTDFTGQLQIKEEPMFEQHNAMQQMFLNSNNLLIKTEREPQTVQQITNQQSNIRQQDLVVSDTVVQNVADNQRIKIVRIPTNNVKTLQQISEAKVKTQFPDLNKIQLQMENNNMQQLKIIRIEPNAASTALRTVQPIKLENIKSLTAAGLLVNINSNEPAGGIKKSMKKFMKTPTNLIEQLQVAELRMLQNRWLPIELNSSNEENNASTSNSVNTMKDDKLLLPTFTGNLEHGANAEQVLDAMIAKATEVAKRDERILALPNEFIKAVEAVPERKQIIEEMRKKFELTQNATQEIGLIPAIEQDMTIPTVPVELKPLYLPLNTITDPELFRLRRMYRQYRFMWSCPYCPREYEQKHSFRTHLHERHAIQADEYQLLQVKVVPSLITKKPGKYGKTKSKKLQLEENMEKVDDYSAESMEGNSSSESGRTQSENEKTKLECNKCGRAYSSIYQLRDHLDSNCSRDPRYCCIVCGKSYFSMSTLNCHMSIHTGELPHQCHFCPKRFRTRGQLTVHHRTHTGERPFVCQVCSQSFTHRETLISHLSRHINMKRYKCYNCNQLFSCISGLSTHRATRPDTCGRVKLNSRAVGPRVRVIRGQVFFESQPEINPYLRTEDPQTVLTELQNQQAQQSAQQQQQQQQQSIKI